MLGSIGMPELLVMIVIALIIFGPGKLPDAGRAIGEAIRGFKKALTEPEKLAPGKLKKPGQKGKTGRTRLRAIPRNPSRVTQCTIRLLHFRHSISHPAGRIPRGFIAEVREGLPACEMLSSPE